MGRLTSLEIQDVGGLLFNPRLEDALKSSAYLWEMAKIAKSGEPTKEPSCRAASNGRTYLDNLRTAQV